MDYQQREQLRQAIDELERVHAIHTPRDLASTYYNIITRLSVAGDHVDAQALRTLAQQEETHHGTVDITLASMKAELQKAELEAQQEQSSGIVSRTVYFDAANSYALGASAGPHAYYGEFFHTESMDVPNDLFLPGCTRQQIEEAVRYRRGY